MNALILNSGSSSVKFNLYRMPEERLIVQGKSEKEGNGNTRFTFKTNSKKEQKKWESFSYSISINEVLNQLINPENKFLGSLREIDVVGHRLIHGGEEGAGCVEITETLLERMRENVSLAPLHYPANIRGIEAISQLIPSVLQAGVFDTAFHHTHPPKAFLYGIPLKWYEKYRVRRYGFHGTSHKYAALRGCEIAGIDYQNARIVSCHLGNGASVCAIKKGKSIDTSMGFTPVEGLMMGSRSGDIDAGVIVYLQQHFGYSAAGIQQLINNEGGLLGLSGVSSDYRDVQEAAENGNKNAETALQAYHYRGKKYIGAYAAALGGIDLLVFTGGVGENSVQARKMCLEETEFLGIHLSEKLNNTCNGSEAIINKKQSKVKIAIVPANEELMIAREVAELANCKFTGKTD